jgi:hypothetical protein
VTHHVFLVPGFFGFANLGQISYFGHVARILGAGLRAAGVRAAIHVVRTHPTSSLPRRAARLAETIADEAGRGAAPIHVIGHSTGGLDARLFAAPNVSLPTDVNVERLARRVRTLVTIATPHHGTPLAAFFATLRGQRILQLLSLATIHVLHLGRIPITALLRAGGALARLDDGAVNSAILDELFGRLLEDFGAGRRRAVRALLSEVVDDQALLVQLSPESMELFDAAVLPRPGVRGACVVTKAVRPGLRSAIDAGLDPAAQVSALVYRALHRLATPPPSAHVHALAPAQARALRRAYGALPAPAESDGIVPTRAQIWGPVLHAARADHLDVLGHFTDPKDVERDPPHVDWLTTGTGFDRAGFERLWGEVVRFLVRSGG